MHPKISVIIPVFNRPDLIVRSLDSVINQTVKPYEIIVVDNGSVDNTYLTVSEWILKNKGKGINLRLVSESEQGVCKARQKGMEMSEGDYLYFFDSDDLMNPTMLEKASEKLEENPLLDIVCWKCRIHLLTGKNYIPPFKPEIPLENHLINSLFRTQGYLVSKSFLEKAGGWSKFLTVWNDLELGFRLLLNNPKCFAINEILVDIYAQEISITGKLFSSKIGEWEETLNEIERENTAVIHRDNKIVKKIIAYRKIILAALYYKENNRAAGSSLKNMTLKQLSFKEKFLLRFVYYYTGLGFRGAWRIIRYLYIRVI